MTEDCRTDAARTPGQAARSGWRPALSLALFSAASVTLLANVLPARRGLERTRRMLERQEEHNRELEQRTQRLGQECDALENDPWFNRRILHDEFGFTDPDEIRIR